MSVCMFVCLCMALRLPLTSGMMWTPYDWLNKLYSFYIAAVVGMVNGCGLNIDVRVRHRDQPNKN